MGSQCLSLNVFLNSVTDSANNVGDVWPTWMYY